MVGDFFKFDKAMADTVEDANKVTKWFRNHSYALGLLRTCQEEEYGTVLALIVAVITRWTAHYCAAARLLEVMKALLICVARHDSALVESAGPVNSEAQKSAREVIAIIKNPGFWERLIG